MTALGPFEERLLEVVDGAGGSPAVLLVGVLIAFGVGALHALGPGHGKAVTAAWVAGSPAGRRDVAALAVAVALMHTLSALVLGGLLYAVSGSSGWMAALGGSLRIASGLIVLGVGVWLLRRRLPARPHPGARRSHRAARGGRGHDHGHVHDHGHGRGHDHDHDHPGDHDHTGAATAAGVAPTSPRGLLLIAVSGGMLPSPAALLVLTTGLFTGRVLDAILLVAAFGVGLALTLAAVGLAAHDVRRRLQRARSGRVSRVARALPLLGPAALVAAGAILTATAVIALVASV
jgi:nickel/cobalt transporter (NicO) family protein